MEPVQYYVDIARRWIRAPSMRLLGKLITENA